VLILQLVIDLINGGSTGTVLYPAWHQRNHHAAVSVCGGFYPSLTERQDRTIGFLSKQLEIYSAIVGSDCLVLLSYSPHSTSRKLLSWNHVVISGFS